MNVPWRWMLAVAGVAIVGWIGVVIYRAGLEPVPSLNASGPVVASRGRADGHRAEFAAWKFDYDRVTIDSDQVTRRIDGLRDGVYYKNGKPFVRMSASHVIVNSLTNDFTATGPLRIDIDDQGKHRILRTNLATWHNAGQQLAMPNDVIVETQGDAQLSMHAITADLRTGDIKVGKIAGGATP